MQLDAPVAPELATADDASDRITRPNRLAVIDGDVHPAWRSPQDLKPFLSQRWWDYWQTYGSRRKNGSVYGEPYPKSAPLACRRDAWPEEGGRPGSSLSLMQSQYLDACSVEYGILGPLGPTGQGEMNLEFSAAMCRAVNEWQLEAFTRKEKRLKAGIVVPYEDGAASAREIERCGADPGFAQVFVLTRSSEPLGNRRYWPIYEAAARYNLPVAFHVFGTSGHPVSGAGWPSYYVEEGAGHSTSCQTVVTSLTMEGVFERFPTLKVVMVEGGFAWLPALTWRLDKLFERMRDEVPHLKRKPSEYIRQHIYVTTQPMEEPDERRHVLEVMEWIGWDRLLFASDYPHWDFDDPFRAFPAGLKPERHRQICAENGRKVYRLS
jgi:predicted TIM-barrel fold metal-dependent hydrolase